MLHIVLSMVMLLAAMPVFAEQSNAAPPRAPAFGALRPAHADPYRELFAPQKAAPSQVIEHPRVATPKVVCGMTIVPADPKHHPSMVVRPKDDAVDYKIRALDPPVCAPR